MKCKCGKPGVICIRGENQCWDCFDAVRLRVGVHIDYAKPRTRLCDGRPGDPIRNMTVSIAAAFMAQNPGKGNQLCAECFAAMWRDYQMAIEKAVAELA